jgi:5-deoxy-glucuronate isomerase
MRETSTRIVRTIFDQSNMPASKLVLGEVITYPGKWSSYPPHHHPQPEIYHYRFYPEQGFGFGMLGDDVVKIKQADTVLILNDLSHPQTAAPGYAMYYIWVIYNLDGNPYGTPIFEPEHTWVMDKQNDSKIWPFPK